MQSKSCVSDTYYDLWTSLSQNADPPLEEHNTKNIIQPWYLQPICLLTLPFSPVCAASIWAQRRAATPQQHLSTTLPLKPDNLLVTLSCSTVPPAVSAGRLAHVSFLFTSHGCWPYQGHGSIVSPQLGLPPGFPSLVPRPPPPSLPTSPYLCFLLPENLPASTATMIYGQRSKVW